MNHISNGTDEMVLSRYAEYYIMCAMGTDLGKISFIGNDFADSLAKVRIDPLLKESRFDVEFARDLLLDFAKESAVVTLDFQPNVEKLNSLVLTDFKSQIKLQEELS